MFGKAPASTESESAAFGLKVDFAGPGGAIGHGQTGVEIGRLALSHTKLIAALNAGLEEAYERARFDAREKAAVLKQSGAHARSLMVGASAPPSTARDGVAAVWQRDPRTLAPIELKQMCRESSAALSGLGSDIAFNVVAAMSE